MRAPGIGSGLPVADWVDMMVKAEATPKLKQFQKQQQTLDTQISSYGKLKSSLTEFQDSLQQMQKDEAFDKRKVDIVGKEPPFSGSATKDAISGSYDVAVQQLAKEQKTNLGAVVPDTKFEAGKLDFKVGDESFSVDVKKDSSLKDIADAINKSPDNKGVKATIVTYTDENGKPQNELVLMGEKTGEKNSFEVTSSADPSSQLGQMIAGQKTPDENKPQDAILTIDGKKITSASNKVENAIQGLTLDLKEVSEKDTGDKFKTNRVTVGYDNGAVKSSLSGFVEAYNSIIDITDELTKYNRETSTAAPLTGDSLVRNLMVQMREIMTSPSDAEGSVKYLADIGISTERDGKLKIDDEKLDKALEENFTKVGAFFSDKNDGIASKLDNLMKDFVGATGSLTEKDKALNEQVRKLGKEKEAFDKRMSDFEIRMTNQFNAIDAAVTQMQQQMNTVLSVL
ncbi:MAG: flagellar filament capping protein FliD [Plesiomonas sp.]